MWRSDRDQRKRKLLLTAATFEIVGRDLFEFVKQPKVDQDLVRLLRYDNSYTTNVGVS